LTAICSARKKDGTRCTLPAQGQKDRCWAHSPENAAQRRRIAARGGRGKANAPVKELQQQLDDIIARVLDGELVPYRGSVAAQLIGAKIRLLELERKDQERQRDEERLERLERLERNRGRAGRGVAPWGA
jgi:hypothetical protein